MRYTKITSPSNPHIREAIAVKEKRSKYKHRAFIIEGTHLLQMGLASGAAIKRVFFTGDYASKREGRILLRHVSKTNAEMFEVTAPILSKLTDTETPQGIVAIASYTPLKLEGLQLKNSPILVISDGIQDPGNLGTIIRTSDAADADAVILLPGTCDAFMLKTIRATAGSIFNIPIITTDADALIEWLRAKNIRTAVTAGNAPVSIYDADLRGHVAFVLGNETQGVSDKLRKAADIVIRIPILGRAESLNVAVSAALCVYEAVRQRITKVQR